MLYHALKQVLQTYYLQNSFSMKRIIYISHEYNEENNR